MFEQEKTEKRFMAKTVTTKEKIAVKPLRDLVKVSVKDFLVQLDGRQIEDVYELLMTEVEQPLLDMIMQHTRGNQTQAANMLGINRGTLRKKLKKYGLS